MTRFLLDTNIVSDAIKSRPSETLADWLTRQFDDDLFISSQTLGEIWTGILGLPKGSRRSALEGWFNGPNGPLASFAERILPYDQAAALRWAEIMAAQKAIGRPRPGADMIIAATALVHDCVVVTNNERDFAGVVDLINPMRGAVP